ncbi:MAG: hypothetical protein JXA36_06395, partial [Coriobacteriia bacterium]|nr:hypothetical protein [Coriobacteriia bacterium]
MARPDLKKLPEPRAVWLPLLLMALLVPIATMNFTGFGAKLPWTFEPTSSIKIAVVGVLLLA